MEIVEDFLRKNEYLNCVSYLRNNTKNFKLIETLCEFIESNNNIEKNSTFWDDYSIACYYLGKKNKAYNLYNNIFQNKITTLNEGAIKHYMNNFNYYINDNMKKKQNNIVSITEQIGEINIFFSSLTNKIRDKIDENYNPLNPSIIYDEAHDEYILNIRTANYKFDENFRYIGNGYCDTVNYIAKFDCDFKLKTVEKENNLIMPYRHNFYGCEDIRLFYYKNILHYSFTSLSVKEKYLQYICLGNSATNSYTILDGYGDNIIQKNWVPVATLDDNLYFIYSFYPLIVLKYDNFTKNVKLHQSTLPGLFNRWRGGSPAISLEKIGLNDFYLCAIHESNFPKYAHKFVLLKYVNEIFEIYNFSPTFYFFDEKIEFCSGLTISKNKKDFILSFGKLDREIFLSKINIDVLLKGLFNEKQKLIENPNFINNNDNDKYKNAISPYTFVTCWFNLEKNEIKKRVNSNDFYKQKSETLFTKNINIVFYSDDDLIIEYVQNTRKNMTSKTKIIKINIEELPYYKYLDKITDIRNSTNYRNLATNKDTPLFTILTWSKLYFLKDTISKSYFNSEYYMWLDFGISYVANFDNFLNCTMEKKEKISIMSINIPIIKNLNNLNGFSCYLAGGSFCGNKNNIIELHDKFDYYVNILLDKNIAPLEEGVLAYIAQNERDLFEYYYGDYCDIINNRNFMFSRKNIHLIFKNIQICLNENMYDEVRLMISYVLKSFYNGYINLSDDEFENLNNISSKIFYK